MTQRSTIRLPVALVVVAAAVVGAVTTGTAAIVLAAAPWAVCLALGLGPRGGPHVRAAVHPTTPRAMVGDELELRVTLLADRDGRVAVTLRPPAGFLADGQVPPPTIVTAVSAGRRTEVVSRSIAGGWGTHDVGTATIAFDASHGLVRWQGSVADPSVVRIHPTRRELRTLV
ncbi:MAG: hypothetical protein VKL39_24880, partial [Leptolyngbyaceae bacterium]|nr:hypothetical protein [Leptolyngbyaceae bacterium]